MTILTKVLANTALRQSAARGIQHAASAFRAVSDSCGQKEAPSKETITRLMNMGVGQETIFNSMVSASKEPNGPKKDNASKPMSPETAFRARLGIQDYPIQEGK